MKKKKNKKNIKDILKYNFDNLLMQGPLAQILVLGILTGIVALAFGFALLIFSTEEESYGHFVWQSLVHSLDPGVLSGSSGSFGYMFILLIVTILGLFFVGTLISVITSSMQVAIDHLAHGRSKVLEPKKHVLFLGYNETAFEILRIIFKENEKKKFLKNPIVILDDHQDIIKTNEEIGMEFYKFKKTKIICRQGCMFDRDNYNMCSIEKSKQIIITANNDNEVIKTILVCTKELEALGLNNIPITAILNKKESIIRAKIVGNNNLKIIVKEDIIKASFEEIDKVANNTFILNTELKNIELNDSICILSNNELESEKSDEVTILGLIDLKQKIEKQKAEGKVINILCEMRLEKNMILAKYAGADKVIVTNVEIANKVYNLNK